MRSTRENGEIHADRFIDDMIALGRHCKVLLLPEGQHREDLTKYLSQQEIYDFLATNGKHNKRESQEIRRTLTKLKKDIAEDKKNFTISHSEN